MTAFRLADGSELGGLCSPADSSGLDYLQPVILTATGHLPFWNEKLPGSALAALACRHLAKDSHSVFPLTFECSVPVDGVRVAGSIDLSNASSADKPLNLSVRLLPSQPSTSAPGARRPTSC